MERNSDTILNEFYNLKPHEGNRSEELVHEYTQARQKELSEALNKLFFSLSCVNCDCDSPKSYEEATKQGWTDIQPDETRIGWNFLGICPECKDEE